MIGAGIYSSLLGYSLLGFSKSKAWYKIVDVRGDPKKREWEGRQSDTGRRKNAYRAGKGRLILQDLLKCKQHHFQDGPPVARGASLYLSTSSWPPSVEGCLQGCWRRHNICVCPCPPGSTVSEEHQGREKKTLLSSTGERETWACTELCTEAWLSQRWAKEFSRGHQTWLLHCPVLYVLRGPRSRYTGSTIPCQSSVTKPG